MILISLLTAVFVSCFITFMIVSDKIMLDCFAHLKE